MSRSTPLRWRLLMAAGSLFLSVALLEAGLRLAGHRYLAATVLPQEEVDPGARRVLCVGDSFTFGGRTERGETWPAHLERMLPRDARVQVINRGVCEYNSRQLLLMLPEWLEIYEPHALVVLVGAANPFNPWGYRWNGEQGLLPALGQALRGLRVARMARITATNLQGRMAAWRGSYVHFDTRAVGMDGRGTGDGPYMDAKRDLAAWTRVAAPSEDPVEMAWFLHNGGDTPAALRACDAALAGAHEPVPLLATAGHLLHRQGDLEGARARFEAALAADPGSPVARAHAGYFLSNAARDALLEGRGAAAVAWFLDALPLLPDDEYVYYGMAKAFRLQSTWTAGALLDRLQVLEAAHPALVRNRLFQNQVALFTHAGSWDAAVARWLRADLEAVVDLAEATGARTVFQDYPVDYPLANEALAAVAAARGLPLVENRATFRALGQAGPLDPYLFDDDHCTGEGHRVMAENVHRILAAEGLLGP